VLQHGKKLKIQNSKKMENLESIIKNIHEYVSNERSKEYSKRDIDVFFINMLEISSCLAELGYIQGREISTEEEYWFKGSYHLDFWDSEINNKSYRPLIQKVEELNYFRKPNISTAKESNLDNR
jgi:hypothetical protein